MDARLSNKMMKEMIGHFDPSRVLSKHFPAKYLPTTWHQRVWLFLTMQEKPINPEWNVPLANFAETITFRRPLAYREEGNK